MSLCSFLLGAAQRCHHEVIGCVGDGAAAMKSLIGSGFWAVVVVQGIPEWEVCMRKPSLNCKK